MKEGVESGSGKVTDLLKCDTAVGSLAVTGYACNETWLSCNSAEACIRGELPV